MLIIIEEYLLLCTQVNVETRIKRCKDLLRDSPPGLPVGPEESEGQNPPASLQGLLLGACVFTCATDWKSEPRFWQGLKSKSREKQEDRGEARQRWEQSNFKFQMLGSKSKGEERKILQSCIGEAISLPLP